MDINSVLKIKEERYQRQKKIISRYGLPIISSTLNIPGPLKTDEIFTRLHEKVRTIVKEKLNQQNINIQYEEKHQTVLGPECIMAVRGRAQEIKELMIKEEEHHPLGRLFDLDVFDEDFRLISRRNLGYKGRSCLLCHEEAVKCILQRAHTQEDVRKKVEELISEHSVRL